MATFFLAALFVANRAGARRAPIYLALGMGAWYGLLLSGVHATLAGVIRRSADAIDVHAANGVRGAMEPERFATISALSRTLDAANSPIQVSNTHGASVGGVRHRAGRSLRCSTPASRLTRRRSGRSLFPCRSASWPARHRQASGHLRRELVGREGGGGRAR